MKELGYISITDEGSKGVTMGGVFYPEMNRVQVEIEERFQYIGHTFIIHRPFKKQKSGYVVTHERTGFLVSEPKGRNKKSGKPIGNPETYPTPEEAKSFVIARLDQYLAEGNSFNEQVKKYLILVKKLTDYTTLKILKII